MVGVSYSAIARADAREGVQSGGVWAITGLFLLLMVLVGRFAARGGFLDAGALADANAQTFVFLLTVLFVPVLGLAITVQSIVRARSEDLVDLSTEAGRRDLLIGTVLGRWAVLSAAVVVGFGPALVLFLFQSQGVPLTAVVISLLAAILIGLLFVAVGIGISAIARTEWQARAGGFLALFALYAWPFVPLVSVPTALLERFWVVFIFGDLVDALFALRQGSLALSSLFGFVVLGLFVVVPLAAGYSQLDRNGS